MNVERDDPYDPIEDVYFKDLTCDQTGKYICYAILFITFITLGIIAFVNQTGERWNAIEKYTLISYEYCDENIINIFIKDDKNIVKEVKIDKDNINLTYNIINNDEEEYVVLTKRYFKDRTGDITVHIEKGVINTYKNKLK